MWDFKTDTKIESEPSYDIISSETLRSISVASALFTITIGAMIFFANSFISSYIRGLYGISPILGMLVIGGALSIGHNITMKSISRQDNWLFLGVLGVIVTLSAYGFFGAAILAPYSESVYTPAIIASVTVTGVISILSSILIYSKDLDFQKFSSYSATIFIVSIFSVLLGSFVPGSIGGLFLLCGFFGVLVGFTLDLIYEIWNIQSSNRTPEQNGFGLYVAFTGVFVHILQIALEYIE